MDQLAINLFVLAPAVPPASDVGNGEISNTVIVFYFPDDVRIKAATRLHLAEDHIVLANLRSISYWRVEAIVAAVYSWIQRPP